MADPVVPVDSGRRRWLLATGAVALGAPFAAKAGGFVYTPTEITQAFQREVARRLNVRQDDAALYGAMVEMQLAADHQSLLEPQYLLVIDSNPNVQVALLFWRLLPGVYQLLGAAPVSTGGPVRPDYFETPQGLFAQSDELQSAGSCERAPVPICRREGGRVFDFGWQRARRASRRGLPMPMRLQARAADHRGERQLGTACSNGCVLMPASLLDFIDRYGLLDGDAPHPLPLRVPYRGRYMLVVDSEREDRPDWL